MDDPGRAARAAAILTLVGSVNLPIIKFSVDWWNTLHQGESIFRAGGPTIDASMLRPLFVMMAAMTLLYVALLFMAMRNEILRRRVRTLEISLAANRRRHAAERNRPLMTHVGFIVAAYLGDPRRRGRHDRVAGRWTAAAQRRLGELEARGVRRRSAGGR